MIYKKLNKLLSILIVFILLVQMILPVISFANDDDELVTIPFADKNLYEAMKNELRNYDITVNDVNQSITMQQRDVYMRSQISISNYSGENPISKLDGLEYFKNLKTLSLDDNQIIDISVLSNLRNLEKVCLSGNQITDINALSNLTNLEDLELNSNEIIDISPIANLTNLENLGLGGNKISNLSALENLLSLQRLSLGYNPISDINPIANLTNLYYLKIDNCEISDISAISNLNKLDTLRIFNNPISDISAISNLTNLKWIQISGTDVNDIRALSNLTNLEWLWLSDNQISDISPIANLTNLKNLILSSNQISNINALANLTNLKDLELSSNQINNINALLDLTNLEDLELYGNQINDINVLANLTNLRELSLQGNKISDISVLDGLKKLEWPYVSLDGNNTVIKGSRGDIIPLPKMFLEALNEESRVYSANGLEFKNCMLDESGKNVIIDHVPASVTIPLGKAYNSTFEITETGEPDTRTVSSISIVQEPSKKQYIQAKERINVTDGKIKVVYDDNSEQIIDMKFNMITGFNNTKLGVQTVTVNYEGQTATFMVEVIEDTTEEKKEFLLGRDNNSFLHSKQAEICGFYGVENYHIPQEYFDALTRNATQGEKNTIISEEEDTWGGSCHGVSALMGLVFCDKVDLSMIEEGKTNFFDLDLPWKNEKLLNIIQCYFLDQKLKRDDDESQIYWNKNLFRVQGALGFKVDNFNDYDDLSGFLEDFVRTVQEKVVMFDYKWIVGPTGSEGHSILATDCEQLPSGDYIVKLYDLNSVDKGTINEKNPSGRSYFMTISEDFKTFNFEDKLNQHNYVSLKFYDFDKFNVIDFDEEVTETEEEKKEEVDEAVIGFDSSTKFSIKDTESKSLVYDGESFSGDMEIKSMNFITHGEGDVEYKITIPNSEKFTYEGTGTENDIYIHDNNHFVSLKGKNVGKAIIDLDESVEIEGESKDVQIQIDNGINNLSEIEAEKINGIKITKEDENIKVSSEEKIENLSVNNLNVEGKTNIKKDLNTKDILIGKGSTVTVLDNNVENITISKLPTKLKYIKNKENLDVAGGQIKAVYQDKTEKTIDITKEMVTGFDNTKVGKQTLTVTYEGKTTTYEIEIVEELNNNREGKTSNNNTNSNQNNNTNINSNTNKNNTNSNSNSNSKSNTSNPKSDTSPISLPNTGKKENIIKCIIIFVIALGFLIKGIILKFVKKD